jgi:hypothetical protein
MTGKNQLLEMAGDLLSGECALDRKTPDHVYFKSLDPLPLAKAA